MSSVAERDVAAAPEAPARITVPEGMGRPTAGPSALGTDSRRLWRLAWTLAVTDFKMRFFGSALGYLWQIMRPLMLFGVLYAVFATVLQVGDGVKRFPVALLLGIVLYGFFSGVTSGGVKSLVQREPLVRKVEFPRLAVPLATTIAGVLDVVLNFIPVLVFLLASGGQWHRSWLQVPFLLGLLILVTFGLTMLFSALFVRYRDIDPIWDVMLQIIFYGSWIFFPLDTIIRDHKVSETVVRLTLANPLAAILQQMRHALIDPSYLSTSAAMGGAIWLLLPFGVGVVILLLGFRIFIREAPRVAEDL